MKIKLKSNEWYFKGLPHFIVVEVRIRQFKMFKAVQILSESATRRITERLKGDFEKESNLIKQIQKERLQLREHKLDGELHQYIDDNYEDLNRLLTQVINHLNKGVNK